MEQVDVVHFTVTHRESVAIGIDGFDKVAYSILLGVNIQYRRRAQHFKNKKIYDRPPLGVPL